MMLMGIGPPAMILSTTLEVAGTDDQDQISFAKVLALSDVLSQIYLFRIGDSRATTTFPARQFFYSVRYGAARKDDFNNACD